MTYHNFDLQPGYVEDTMLCTMKVGHDDGFEGIEEAVEHFRLTIRSYLESRRQPPNNKCCKKNLSGKKSPNYCQDCGSKLAFDDVSGPETQEFFYHMLTMTIDGASGSWVWDHFEEAGWHLGLTLGDPSDYPLCQVRSIGRWMGREDDERPWLEGDYPDGISWSRVNND